MNAGRWPDQHPRLGVGQGTIVKGWATIRDTAVMELAQLHPDIDAFRADKSAERSDKEGTYDVVVD